MRTRYWSKKFGQFIYDTGLRTKGGNYIYEDKTGYKYFLSQYDVSKLIIK